MITLDTADSLLSTWRWWSLDDDASPPMPGNNWHWLQFGSQQSTPSYAPDTMCAVDSAIATLQRDSEEHWPILWASLYPTQTPLRTQAGAGIDGYVSNSMEPYQYDAVMYMSQMQSGAGIKSSI